MEKLYGPMTDERKVRIWKLWRQGLPMSDIARDIVKPPATVYSYLLYHGGIEPSARVRRPGSLSFDDRETISRCLASGCSMRSISRTLGRSTSTISREISRNGGCSKYRASLAEKASIRRSLRPKPFLLAENHVLRNIVAGKLALDWSPEQISGWLKNDCYGNNKEMQVSHETIYKSLFIQTRGIFKAELKKHLRTKRMFRHAKLHRSGGSNRGQIVDAISISVRPQEIEDRAITGHWEGDLIVSANSSAIATLVERHSRFTVLCKVQNKSALIVVQSLTEQMKKLPPQVLKSLTWDRGQELSAHKTFSVATDMDVYFCDPRSPWQRGTNGLLRQYFPKGTGLAIYAQNQLNEIAAKLNSRPRKMLGFRTPAEVFNEVLQ